MLPHYLPDADYDALVDALAVTIDPLTGERDRSRVEFLLCEWANVLPASLREQIDAEVRREAA